jgi:hypothetical protein
MNRTDQLEKFGRLLSLAGSLNRGSNVADKIKELEILAGELTRHDLGNPVRASFAGWVADRVNEEKPLTPPEWSDKKPDSVGWWWEWTGDIADAPEVVCVVSVDPLKGYYRNQKDHQILDGGPFYSGPIPQPKQDHHEHP